MIIACYSRFLLRRFLRRHARERRGYFFSPQAMPAGLADELKTFGLQPVELPDFSDVERERVLRQYVELIGGLGHANADHPLWWATELAAKNRFTSPLAGLLTDFARCQRAAAVASQDHGVLVIWEPPWPWWAAQTAVQPILRDRPKLLAWPGSRLLARWRGKVSAWLNVLRGITSTLTVVILTRWIGGPRLIPGTGDAPVFLIRSFVYTNSVSSGRFSDPFFGRLHQMVRGADSDAVPLTVVQGTGSRTQVYRRLSGLKGEPVVPLEAYLHVMDVVRDAARVAGALIFRRLSVPKNLDVFGAAFAAAVRELLGSGGWRIEFQQFMHERAARAIMRRHQVRACAQPYEGNAWERMFIKGLRNGPDKPVILGFQHSVVPLAAAGVFVSTAELPYLPLPDKVLTTGQSPSAILQKFSALPVNRYAMSGTLRYEYLQQLKQAPRRGTTARRILVALEGVGPVVAMLDYAIQQAAQNPEVSFCLRAHPVLPLETLLARLHLDRSRLPGNIEISTGRSVQDDVIDADAVLYWGSTVALEAVFMGRPVIHFSTGELLSYDPLFELHDFKWTTYPWTPLAKVLTALHGMADDAFARMQARAQAYVSAYFEPVAHEVVRSILKQAVYGDRPG